MYLKYEFKRRIFRLRNVIDTILVDDGNLNSNLYGFFPCLWSVFSLIWSHKSDPSCFLKHHGDDSVLYHEFVWPDSSPYPDDVPFPFDADKYGK